ncbi:MAG: hypothetical protein PHC61_18555, partial [Chitinivibrionales bacterium]|nr:hypothetical protein [Chitinivibrionales bacterium]
TLSGPSSGGNDKSALMNGLQVRELPATGIIVKNTNTMPLVNSNFQRATIYDIRGRVVGISQNGKLAQSARAGIYLLKSAAVSEKIVKQ